MAPRYLVGIDLGTTNSALAYIDLKLAPKSGKPKVQAFAVPQLVAAGDVAPRQLLPSFLYRPGAHDLPAGATALPWNANATDPVGEFARETGARIPGRLVSSAKSWLCHPGVDRMAALLPWGAPADVPRLSPLEASARYLKHLVEAWNFTHAKMPEDRLEKIPVVLTVPASFDDVARTLTMEAAKLAGLPHATLLEEPQAAFYCWQHLASSAELAKLRPGMVCLVVDVGGGTTDFSLISAVEEEGELRFVREAVGDHLLLGGDNMDLALARDVEGKLAGAKLDAMQFAGLVQACRRAKETLLAPNPPATHPVTVIGRGRAVVGGTIAVQVSAQDVRRVIGDGFFPIVKLGDAPHRSARVGLHEMGLPYVHDAAITRHLAAFVDRHLPAGRMPEAVLFNGGVFQPESLRQRLLDAVEPWYAAAKQKSPIVLTTPSLDLAVAFGAAAYGWTRHSGGPTIGGGIARSYYIEVQAGTESKDGLHVMCIVPRHLEEGKEIKLAEPHLDLAIGEPVVFPLYTSTARDDVPGSVLNVSPGQLKKLPPVHTVLRGGKKAGSAIRHVPVTLAARTTPIGTLELNCVAVDGGNRWRLEFGTRDIVDDDDEEPAPNIAQPPDELLPESLIEPAANLIGSCYRADSPSPNELVKALESQLGRRRDEWPTLLCRRLWETVEAVGDERRRSPAHLSRWYNLAGFVLRPGFGDPLDRFRVETLWKLLNAPKPGGPPPAEPVGADAWIMWRRVAGGLTSAFQKTLFDRLRPALLGGGKGKGSFKPGANELAEMWRAAASLERLELARKVALGEALIKQLRQSPAPTYVLWSLTRLGARELLYGSMNAVVHPENVAGWIDAVLAFQPTHESERLAWGFCLAQMARQTGQRALDVEESRRKSVAAALRSANMPEAWPRMVEEVVGREQSEQSQFFGDSLPVGLRIRH
ncbi:MAG: Hsp70 family protein [Gemmataceae bacterium]